MSNFDYTGPGANTIDNFEGGTPSARDIVPGVLFTVLLGLSIPLLAWRLFSGKHRTYILINSVMFFITRLISLIMRAYMSRHSYGPNLVIAETVLLTIGWLFLLNGFIDLLQRHVAGSRDEAVENSHGDRAVVEHKERNSKWVKYFATFLRLLLLVALATIIAAGALFRHKLNEREQSDAVANLIKASYILGLAASAIGIISTLITHFVYNRSKKRTGFILSYSIPLLVSSIYRVVEVFTGYRATTRQLAAFWTALIAMELIAYALTLAISIPKWFGTLKERIHRRPSDQEKLHGRASSVDESRFSMQTDPRASHTGTAGMAGGR